MMLLSPPVKPHLQCETARHVTCRTAGLGLIKCQKTGLQGAGSRERCEQTERKNGKAMLRRAAAGKGRWPAADAAAAAAISCCNQKKMSISSLLWNMSQKGLGSCPPTSLNDRTGCARLMDSRDSLNLRFLMSTEFSK